MDTIILPSISTFFNSLVNAVNHIFSELPNMNKEDLYNDLLSLELRVEAWYANHAGDLIYERQVSAIKDATSKFCVITGVDKSKSEIAFTCPRFYQWRMINMHIADKQLILHTMLTRPSPLSTI